MALKSSSNMNMKKIGIIALALLLLFLPTVAAIAVYNAGPLPTEPLTEEKVLLLRLDYPNGTVRNVYRDDKDKVYELFRAMTSNSVPVKALPADVDRSRPVVATFRDLEQAQILTFYFSADASAAYYIDEDKKVRSVAPADLEQFLSRTDLSGFLRGEEDTHPQSGEQTTTPPEVTTGTPVGPDNPGDFIFTLPVLRFNASTVIPHKKIDWYSADESGALHHKEETGTETPTFALTNDSVVTLSFDIAPSDCMVYAYDDTDNSTLYKGSLSSISLANLMRSTKVRFEISANWKHNDNSYYGSANYVFYANVDVTVHAQFKVNRTTINMGEFIILSGINIDDPSKIVVSANPALNYTPVFFGETVNGTTVYSALLPFSYGLNKGEYSLNVSCGSDAQVFRITVKDYVNGYVDGPTTQIGTYPDSIVKEICVPAALDEYYSLLAQITAENESVKYFSGTFLDYRTAKLLSSTATLRMGFGRYITVTNAAAKFSYEHPGWDFQVASGVEIPAMNSGKVVYVGTSALLGKFVVIDHGCGLKTWYAHLSEVSVTVGTVVTQNQTIGKTGTTGLANDKYRLHIGATIYDIPVAPDSLFLSTNLAFPNFN